MNRYEGEKNLKRKLLIAYIACVCVNASAWTSIMFPSYEYTMFMAEFASLISIQALTAAYIWHYCPQTYNLWTNVYTMRHIDHIFLHKVDDTLKIYVGPNTNEVFSLIVDDPVLKKKETDSWSLRFANRQGGRLPATRNLNIGLLCAVNKSAVILSHIRVIYFYTCAWLSKTSQLI